MFNLALCIFMVLSPILFLPLSVPGVATLQFYQFGYFGSSINLVQLQIFQYGAIILFLCALLDKPRRVFDDRFFPVLFFIYIISIYRHPSTIGSFSIIGFGVLLFYLVSVYSCQKIINDVFKVIIFVSFVNSVFAILQFFGINLIYHPKHEIVGLMSYKTQLGIYQAIAVPIAFSIHPLLALIPLPGLILAKSGTALFGVIFGMMYFFRNRLKLSPVHYLAIFGTMIVLFSRFFYKFSLKFKIWSETVRMSFDNFLFGKGIGVFRYIDTETFKKPLEYTDPYSIYLQVFYFLGLFGLLTFLLFVYNRFKNTAVTVTGDALKSSCLIILVCGAVYSLMDYSRLAGTTIVLFGLLNCIKGDKHENSLRW